MIGPNCAGRTRAYGRWLVWQTVHTGPFPHSARVSHAFVLKFSTTIDAIHMNTRVHFGEILIGDACLTA